MAQASSRYPADAARTQSHAMVKLHRAVRLEPERLMSAAAPHMNCYRNNALLEQAAMWHAGAAAEPPQASRPDRGPLQGGQRQRTGRGRPTHRVRLELVAKVPLRGGVLGYHHQPCAPSAFPGTSRTSGEEVH